MHLTVTRTGGMTGITRQWSTDIADTQCDPLLSALTHADKASRNHPDERMYQIRLGTTTATVPEHHALHGTLATLIARAQHST